MGSSQSTPTAATPQPSLQLEPQRKDAVADATNNQENPPPKRKQNLSGFALVQRRCRRKKMTYDKCYSELYGGFVSAKSTDNSECEELFDDWRECVLRGMKKDRDKRGVKAPGKESILADLDEGNE